MMKYLNWLINIGSINSNCIFIHISIQFKVEVHIRIVSNGLFDVLDWLLYIGCHWNPLWTAHWGDRMHLCLDTFSNWLLHIYGLLGCWITEILWQFQQWLSLFCSHCRFWLLIRRKLCFCFAGFRAIVHCVIIFFGVNINMILDVCRLSNFDWLVSIWTWWSQLLICQCFPVFAFLDCQLFKYIFFVFCVCLRLFNVLIFCWELINWEWNYFGRSEIIFVWRSESYLCDWCFVVWTDGLRVVVGCRDGFDMLLDCVHCWSECFCNKWCFLLRDLFCIFRRHLNLDRSFFMKRLKECFSIADIWRYHLSSKCLDLLSFNLSLVYLMSLCKFMSWIWCGIGSLNW